MDSASFGAMNNNQLTIVADAHIACVESAFSQLPGFDVELRIVESKEINSALLRDADILLTRSSTKVNAELLAGTPVCFAATATIGDDHYDKAWLADHQVAFASAAGSSTGSVLEYMLATLLELHALKRIRLPECCVGIIGAGRIGGSLGIILESLGLKVLYNDPPRSRHEGEAGFSDMETLLHEADILTLHTPLHHSGEDATFHLINRDLFKRFKGKGIINAARGGVVDNISLLHWLKTDAGNFAVLDCWEHEPNISIPLLSQAGLVIPTPHIAGHSLDGKTANTLYIYQALCRFLKIAPNWDMGNHLPPRHPYMDFIPTGDDWSDLHRLSQVLYPIRNDVQAMRSWSNLPGDEAGKRFSAFRRHYPERRAWDATPIIAPSASASLIKKATSIGIKII